MEFSQPKNLQAICNGNDWDSIKTETAFIDGVLKTVVPAGIYSPRSTYTECRAQPALMTSGVEQPSVDALPVTSGDGTRANESATRSSGSGDTTPKDKLVGCSEKYKHLFFGCE